MWIDLITKNNEKVYYPDVIISNYFKSLKIYKDKYKSNNIKYYYNKRKISKLAVQIKIKPTIKERNILIIPGTHDIKDIYSYCKFNLKKFKKDIFFIKLHPKNKFSFEDEKRIKKIKDISQKNFNKIIVSSTSTISYDLHLLNKKYSKKNNYGFVWNDKNFNINWKIKKPILSDKDRFLMGYKTN